MPELLNNEIRLNNIRGIKTSFELGKKDLNMITNIRFTCQAEPGDIALLMKMQKQKLPLNAVILSPQKDLPFGEPRP
jgi:hypothetical protein